MKVTWVHRSDRPSWHPDDCNLSCCWWRVVHDPEAPCGSIQCATCYPLVSAHNDDSGSPS